MNGVLLVECVIWLIISVRFNLSHAQNKTAR